MLVLRCYGLCTVLNSPGWLVSVGVKASVQRTGVRVVREGELQGQEESSGAQRERDERGRVVLNSPIWTPPTGGWSNQSVCMGRSPTHVHGSTLVTLFM